MTESVKGELIYFAHTLSKKFKECGFNYYLSKERIEEYRKKPADKRLLWLYQLNLFRVKYPQRIKKIQDKFRSGEIGFIR